MQHHCNSLIASLILVLGYDADGSFADYSEEAKTIDGQIPVLNVVGQAHAGAARTWLAKNAPHSKTVALGNHMMFREYPDQFNAALDAFFAKLR